MYTMPMHLNFHFHRLIICYKSLTFFFFFASSNDPDIEQSTFFGLFLHRFQPFIFFLAFVNDLYVQGTFVPNRTS